ncbi:MAG: hypothetical protein IJC83_03940 [Oscillospiraceae bacterium]|nr:hypothetical protein [Oscillospiraceae bacterium]
MKRNIILATAILYIFSLLSGCYYSPEELYGTSFLTNSADSSSSKIISDEIIYSEEFKLGYNKAESLNPYKTQSDLNLRLSSLMFDSLVRLNNNYEPVLHLAESVTIDNLSCKIVIKNGITFTDNSPLTADDVITNLDYALTTSSPYRARLSNIAGYSKVSDSEILITLKKPDILFANLLNFPIIKITSDEDKPIGTGRYCLKSAGTSLTLLSNKNHFTGKKPSFEDIALVSLPGSDAYMNSIKLGTISFHFDDLSGNSVSMSGADNSYVNLNNIVFLGVNHSNTFLKNSQFKKAISLALDRDTIVTNAYSGRASKTDIPLNPQLYLLSGVKSAECLQDADASNRLLDELGYTEKNADGIRVFDEKPISLSLLVNSDNSYRVVLANLIRDYLKLIGIECIIEALPFDEYRTKVSYNNYDLYIGEMKLCNNMELSSLITIATKTKNSENTALSDFSSFQSGVLDTESYLSKFKEDYPFIPIIFRKGVIAYARNIQNNIIANESDVFYNIEEWGFFK